MSKKHKGGSKQPRKAWVHVAIPTMGNVMSASLAGFCAKLDRLSIDPKVPYLLTQHIINGQAPVEFARNVLVGHFLHETKAERLWFIDSDMGPKDSALQMLGVDADIVIPIAFNFDHATDATRAGMKLCIFLYNKKGDHKFSSIVPDEGTPRHVEVDAGGCAAMLIRRRVLEDPRMHLPTLYMGLDDTEHDLAGEPEGKQAPAIFRTLRKPNGQTLRGEDLDFCLRAKQLGYRVVADLGVRFGHHKTIDLDEAATMMMEVADRALRSVRPAPNVGVRSHADDQVGIEGNGRPAGPGVHRDGQRPVRGVGDRPWAGGGLPAGAISAVAAEVGRIRPASDNGHAGSQGPHAGA